MRIRSEMIRVAFGLDAEETIRYLEDIKDKMTHATGITARL